MNSREMRQTRDSFLIIPVNNAGLSRGRTIVEATFNDNNITLKTNLLAPFLLSREFLPKMIQRNHGHIFNVSSMSAYIPPPGLADYAASKAGLIAFHEVCNIYYAFEQSLRLLLLIHIHSKFKALAQELRVQKAPKVRNSLAVLSFTKTPLFKGETNQSKFLMPLLHVDTVVDAIVDTLDSGLSRTIFLPGIFGFFAGLVRSTHSLQGSSGYIDIVYSAELPIGSRMWFVVALNHSKLTSKGDSRLIQRLEGWFDRIQIS